MQRFLIRRKIVGSFLRKPVAIFDRNAKTSPYSVKFRFLGGFELFRDGNPWITCSRKKVVACSGVPVGTIMCKGFLKGGDERYFMAELTIGADTYAIIEDEHGMHGGSLTILKNRQAFGRLKMNANLVLYPHEVLLEADGEDAWVAIVLALYYWYSLPDGVESRNMKRFADVDPLSSVI